MEMADGPAAAPTSGLPKQDLVVALAVEHAQHPQLLVGEAVGDHQRRCLEVQVTPGADPWPPNTQARIASQSSNRP